MPMYIPPEHTLTDNQLEVSYIPLSGRYLITGGPGSGKTTIALYRTMYIKREDPNASVATFLFTNALMDFFNAGINQLKIKSEVKTWASWQHTFLCRHGGWKWRENVPWDALSDIILEHYEVEEEYDHLIIDEAQDFKESDLKVMNLLAENITIFADTNQSIRDLGPEMGQDRLETISRVLDIDDEDSFLLKENHRNTRCIIKAAIPLAPDDVDIDLQLIMKPGTPPTLATYSKHDSQVEFICQVIRNNLQRDIAILHLKNACIRDLHDAVAAKLNSTIPLELLRATRFNFSQPSVKFCTLDSVKGLEFDLVILPCLSRDDYWIDRRNITRLYVGMTRPRLDLVMICPEGNGAPAIFDIPPELLNRINLT